ncbi:MAG TPA: GNAT family N-acetyltransferase [Burkholderiales bacterium]|nr:GNAT family N-acetyltransferase [Burkholderiales bacterium]
MDILFSNDEEEISWGELANLYELAPLGKKRAPEKLELAFRNSLLKVFVYDGKRLVGAGRALSDGVWRAAIYDVAVLPDYQGKGIGSQIIRHLVEHANVEVITLYAAPGKEAFYERFGFRKMKTAMAIMLDPEERKALGFIE